MGLVVFTVCVAGLYFILSMFHSLSTHVAFHAAGITASWFAVLMVVGSLLCARFCLHGKR